MADARRARAERLDALAARVAQTAPVDGPPRHSLSFGARQRRRGLPYAIPLTASPAVLHG